MTRALNSVDPDSASSADLLARAREGSTDAIAGLYRIHARSLFALAYHLTGSREDAEDIVHDVFLGLPEALRHYEERGAAEGWLKRVAARLALTRLRSIKRTREVDLQLLVDVAVPGEPLGITGIALARALSALPQTLRQVFLLKEVEGYSHAEISAFLDISVAASQVRFHRAIKHLRRELTSHTESP